jgi:hypothetical protein
MHCCCVGTVQLVEISMRPRIGVLDLRVAVVLDPPAPLPGVPPGSFENWATGGC